MARKRAKEAIKDPFAAYYYARKIIKGRWYQAELNIMKDPRYAYTYALHVIRGRWPEAEDIIRKNKYCWEEYISFFPL